MRTLRNKVVESLDRGDIEIAVLRDATDPFRDETRKAKRNLIASAFVAIVLGSLDVGITSFAGVTVAAGDEARAITQGLAALAVLYFAMGYFADAAVDYWAWRATVTNLSVTPYLSLVRTIYKNQSSWEGQLKNVAWQLEYHRNPTVAQTPQGYKLAEANVMGALKTLEQITGAQESVAQRVAPLLASWERATRTIAFQLQFRRVVRWMRIWLWDLSLPAGLAVLAILKTGWSGVQVTRVLFWGS